MLSIGKPTHVGARLETVRPAMVAMEPSFLTARSVSLEHDGERAVRDEAQISPLPCPGCGRVHRDRLVRFFQVRWVAPPAQASDRPMVAVAHSALAPEFGSPSHLAVSPRMLRADRPMALSPEFA